MNTTIIIITIIIIIVIYSFTIITIITIIISGLPERQLPQLAWEAAVKIHVASCSVVYFNDEVSISNMSQALGFVSKFSYFNVEVTIRDVFTSTNI